MNTADLIGGLFFILIGILVYLYPNLLAGYNTMSKEEKKKVKIKTIKKIVSISFIAYGLFLALFNGIFFLDVENIILISLPIFLIILVIVINLPRFRIK